MKDHGWIPFWSRSRLLRRTIRLKAAPLVAAWDPLVPIVPPHLHPRRPSPNGPYPLLSATEHPSRSQVLILNSNMLTSYFYFFILRRRRKRLPISRSLPFSFLSSCRSIFLGGEKSPPVMPFRKISLLAKIIAIMRRKPALITQPKWLLLFHLPPRGDKDRRHLHHHYWGLSYFQNCVS